ncbi:unnamed protein product [Polarella glacialis]|uniref:Uncharacterized protein n=1 Tax=Polarella glacialis TaxID=89957 RepID=A0A813E8M9_POLGL|nr:unnamed protein product [Polarella glacialis]CAE8698747.1 unnamed protein product [Polarella glacialis]
MEDEEAQILTRWTICGVMFGWVTMLPVLLMQPHEERPRQHLFRQYLLKPCLLLLPIWIIFWILDCIELLCMFQIIHPFYYFAVCHSLIPAVLVWYLFQMQAADEKLVMDQRKSRSIEAQSEILVAIEDPSPVFLKELISMNPVAMVWLGACAAIPIVVSSLLTPYETRRAKLAQGYVNIVYTPLTVLQLVSLSALYQLRFADVPRFYLAGFGLLLSLPCFFVWCLCLVCSARFAKQDLASSSSSDSNPQRRRCRRNRLPS